MRLIAFRVWAALLVIAFGLGFFGLASLAIAWFEPVEGVAGPVTEPAALTIPALLTGSALAADNQNVVPALISLATVGSLLALHPRRAGFLD